MHALRAFLVSALALAPAISISAQEVLRTPTVQNLPPVQAAPPMPGVYTLEQISQLAMANSPVLRQARARVDQTEGLAVQAGLYPNPMQNSGNPNQLGGNGSLYSVGFQQEIVRANKLGLNQSAAMQNVRQANLEFIRQRFELLTDLRQQFFILLAAQQRVTTLTELRAIAEQSTSTSQKLLQGGQGSEPDVLLLRVELRRIEASLRSAEAATVAARRQLAALTGLVDLKIDRVLGDLMLPLPDFNDPQVRQQLLTTSSLVESARAEVARNQFLLQRAEVEVIPNLILNSGYQWQGNLPHSQALIGVYFNIPIWDRNQGNIRAAGANVRQANAQFNAVQNDLVRQLAEALGRYRAAQSVVALYETGILPDAKRTLKLVQQAYEAGQVEFLKILQTQRSLVEAQLDFITAEQERVTAAADIAGLLQLDQFP
ncbi:MAG TPA: TolC family protein [Pirellulales bacterium]|nr:TolC family protein [Pirellulales bacterium]